MHSNLPHSPVFGRFFPYSLGCLLAFSSLALTSAQAQVAFDNFESNSFSGGSGWTQDWTHSGAGGVFLNTGSVIDGTYAAGLFTAGAGTSTLTRTFTTLDTGAFSASWSVRGQANMFEIGVNLLGLKSNSDTRIATLKFDSSNTGLRLNDGGSDFTAAGGVTYSDGAIYDVTFSSIIGSAEYFWSVTQRGGNSASNASAFTYSGGATLTNVSGIQFFWNAPAGGGNDGFIDSVSIVPEPSAYGFLAAITAAACVVIRRRRRLE